MDNDTTTTTTAAAAMESTQLVGDEAAPEERVVADGGNGFKICVDPHGGLSLSRAPASESEYVHLFDLIYNDWAQRIECDPTWLAVISGTRDAATPFAALEDANARMARLQLFYHFLMTRHDKMMCAQHIPAHQTLMIKATGGTVATKILAGTGVRVMPLGIGDHFAWLLLSTPERPHHHYIACADLSEPELNSVGSLMFTHGVDNVTEALVREKRSQQYVVDENWFLPSSNVVFASVCGRAVTIVACDVDDYGQPHGVLSVISYMPGYGSVRIKLDGTSYATHRRCLAATLGPVMAVALPETSSGAPRALLVYNLAASGEPPMVHRRQAVSDDNVAVVDAVTGAPVVAGITALTFDQHQAGRLIVAYDDLTSTTWQLPSPAEVAPGQWAQKCAETYHPTAATRRVAPTATEALETCELQPVLADIDMRQPLRWLRAEMGAGGGRLLGAAENNTWLFTRDLNTAGANTPTISQTVATTGGIHMGTLPLIHYPGTVTAVSLASAGNYAIIHYFPHNTVQLLSLRDNSVLWTEKMSTAIAASRGRDLLGLVENATPDGEQARTASDDPYQATFRYSSTWAALGRAAIQLPNGDLYVLDALDVAVPSNTVDANSL